MRSLDVHLIKFAAILRGDQEVTVNPTETADLLRQTMPELFGVRRPSAFDCAFGDGPSLGRSVHWPHGRVSYTAGPHVPAVR